MKKRIVVGLLAGGMLAAMLPGVVAAEGQPDVGLGQVCQGERITYGPAQDLLPPDRTVLQVWFAKLGLGDCHFAGFDPFVQ